ncbi:MAG: N-acetylmuramoyl-L-alanine amidase [Calditrichaeota bacterium]|nr:MAG: N-acetylmuramoyl-L-alanine amidase [Calditrichota bacterium]MBL1206783.1 N-acetylmuramoyl-L-alanine amidase [Calditrichota bacterium]NOG46611.1 N-acetylmuramoyl-L-alanine amidase [Calditrichota bacterium]
MKHTSFLLVLFASSLLHLSANYNAPANQVDTVIIDNNKGDNSLQEIPSFKKWGSIYISLNDFVIKTGFGIYTNESRHKSVLYVGSDKATFTSNNNYVILNDHAYQLTFVPLWKNGELWVPAQMLVELFNSYTAHRFSFDRRELIFSLGMKDVNLTGIKIAAKENGTLITVHSSKQFSKKDISLKVANGWFHIDVFGGKIDSSMVQYIKTSGVVSKIEVIEFDQIVSLAFKLKRKILSRELVLNENAKDFHVNLRTNEKVEAEVQASKELDKQKKEWLIDTIVIDAGHGGKDPGAIGYKGLKEKDITLGVALKLGQLIAKNMPGVKIIYTRKNDTFIPLWKRTKIANENKGKLFISLHCNSNNNKKVRGFETYFLSADKDKNKQAQSVVLKENESIKFEHKEDQKRYEGINFILATMAQSAFIRQSQYFASVVQNSFAKTLKPLGLKDRGVKQGRFWVMVGATMPNILVEIGFVSNKHEGLFLKKNANQMKIAKAVLEGIQKYKKDIEAAI